MQDINRSRFLTTLIGRKSLTPKDVLLILATGLFILIASLSESLIFQKSAAIPLTLCGVYFLRKNEKKLAFSLPVLIPSLAPLILLSGGILVSVFYGKDALIFSLIFFLPFLVLSITHIVPSIFVTYVCLLMYHLGFNVLSKKNLPLN